MNIAYKFGTLAFAAIAAVLLTPGRAALPEAASTRVVTSQTRCTKLKYPTAKEVVAHQKYLDANDGIPQPGEFGSRCTRLWAKHPLSTKFLPNTAPTLSLKDDLTEDENAGSNSAKMLTRGKTKYVQLVATGADGEKDSLAYTWSVDAGKLFDRSTSAEWTLKGVRPGAHTVTVEADDGCGCINSTSETFSVLPAEWKRFNLNSAHFSVMFPGDPEITDYELGIPSQHLGTSYWVRLDDKPIGYYSAGITIWEPGQRIGTLEEFKTSHRKVTADLGTTLTETPISYAGMSGYDLVTEGKDGQVWDIRYLAAPNGVYGISYMHAKSDPEAEANRRKFFDSFTLIK